MNDYNMDDYEKKAISEYLQNKDYSGVLGVISKGYRMQAFQDMFNIIPDEEKINLFKEVYSSMEYNFREIKNKFLQKIIKYKQPITEITPDEKGYVTVYRGESSESTPYKKALSWTTDLDTAIFFANRWKVLGAVGKVNQGKVHIDNIICYIEDRKEKEVIVMRGSVEDVKQIN